MILNSLVFRHDQFLIFKKMCSEFVARRGLIQSPVYSFCYKTLLTPPVSSGGSSLALEIFKQKAVTNSKPR